MEKIIAKVKCTGTMKYAAHGKYCSYHIVFFEDSKSKTPLMWLTTTASALNYKENEHYNISYKEPKNYGNMVAVSYVQLV